MKVTMFCIIYCLMSLLRVTETFLLPNIPPLTPSKPDPGQPLFVTPYVQAGKFNDAQQLSKVSSIQGLHHQSYSGYITVNKTHNSNLFFWFFPAKVNHSHAPVILYLEGGPGYTSLPAIFLQTGPVRFDDNMNLVDAKVTWTEKYSVIYLDNPVGTGYSFTEEDAGYATNQDDVARDLYSFLLQFFKIFHQYSTNELYIAGESYGGKYLPAIGYKVHAENPHTQQKINMKGLFFISGYSDPVSMIPHYGPFLFYIGMLSEKERDIFESLTNKTVSLIKRKKYHEAFLVNTDLFFGTYANNTRVSYFYNFTGSLYTGNFLKTESSVLAEKTFEYINRTEIRRAIHVGNRDYNPGQKVFNHMQNDTMKSVKPWVTVLMDNYKVMYLNGQLDPIAITPGTEAFLMSVPWKGLDRYKTVDKIIWKVNPNDTEPAGYVRQVDDFYQVVVRNAGHLIAGDQPERCYDLLQRFIEGRSFAN